MTKNKNESQNFEKVYCPVDGSRLLDVSFDFNGEIEAKCRKCKQVILAYRNNQELCTKIKCTE